MQLAVQVVPPQLTLPEHAEAPLHAMVVEGALLSTPELHAYEPQPTLHCAPAHFTLPEQLQAPEQSTSQLSLAVHSTADLQAFDSVQSMAQVFPEQVTAPPQAELPHWSVQL